LASAVEKELSTCKLWIRLRDRSDSDRLSLRHVALAYDAESIVAYNLRFPGQIFDGQADCSRTGSGTMTGNGRYVESDPMGIRGGINTYLYSNADSLSVFDRSG